MPRWFRSLRLRLQVWHALILLVVISGFGSVLYREIARSRWDEIDAELLAAGRVVEGALRALPRPILDSLAQDIGRPRRAPPPPPPHRSPRGPIDDAHDRGPNEQPDDRRNGYSREPIDRHPGDGAENRVDQPDRKRPPPPRGPGRAPGLIPPGPSRLEWDSPAPNVPPRPGDEDWERHLAFPLSLPEPLGHGEGPAYFIIWRRDGSVLRQANAPYEDLHRPAPPEMARERRNVRHRERGPLREVFLRGPEDTLICVGRSVRGEQQRLASLGLQFVLAGGVILAGGLLGGWWLSHSAIAPIDRMSQTARKISAANLTERMDLTGIDLELAQLGSVLNNMLERLDTAFTAQQRFTADASHELRTPLAIMLSTLELALAKDRTPEEYRDQLAKCRRAALRMQGLIDALLTLARTETQSPEASTQEVTLQKIVEESVDALRPLARERQVEVRLTCEPMSIRGNAMQLGQVVTNLVQNAILYNHPGGRVDIELRRGEEAMAVLSVSDTGPGISEADLPHIFERFYRVDAARSRSQGGSGLGLAICKHIVARHGGKIDVHSQLGCGSTFTVTLPSLHA